MLAETFAVRATRERTINDAPTDDAGLARERGQGGDSPRSRKSRRARARERARRRRRVTREYAAERAAARRARFRRRARRLDA